MLALSFEPAESGYIYYHWRWSRGIPVTAEERDAYLRIPALGSRQAWRKGIANRATLPPRAYQPTYRKLLAALPASTVIFGLLVGLPLAASGMAELWSISGAACLIGGLALIGFAGQIAFAKAAEARKAAAGDGGG
ncbi:MAG: hypothetical protein JWN66_5011 [Sphingomonas bacterium]|uniref:hypothetical protein n=1 Tax=Sphingomonas bacterium TaxID=1895847 RepID=UPI00260E765A|nr:hypothetical protein [Sphingomonas bacterium]MDB5707895.1 hypothetical protein [Sphingomonas bacterium]